MEEWPISCPPLRRGGSGGCIRIALGVRNAIDKRLDHRTDFQLETAAHIDQGIRVLERLMKNQIMTATARVNEPTEITIPIFPAVARLAAIPNPSPRSSMTIAASNPKNIHNAFEAAVGRNMSARTTKVTGKTMPRIDIQRLALPL